MGEKRKRQHIPSGFAIINTRGPRKYAVLHEGRDYGRFDVIAEGFRGQYEATMWLYKHLALLAENMSGSSEVIEQ